MSGSTVVLVTGASAGLGRSIRQGIEPAEVAATVARIVAARKPRLHYRVGSEARWVPRLKWFLPERMFQGGMRRRFDLDG